MNIEQYHCGCFISFLDENCQSKKKCALKLEDDKVPYIDYVVNHGNNWGDFQDCQVVKDLIEFNKYVKRTRYVDRSFEENLYLCLSQIGNLNGVVITSEDRKHKCSVKKVGYPDMEAYKLDIDGKTTIIYELTNNLREITLFSMIVMGSCFL